MKWERLGKIFEPDGSIDWMRTHCTIPIPEKISESLYKIYFSPRDQLNRSHVAWVSIDMNDPLKVIDYSRSPLLRPGEIGAFDDSGAMANCILDIGDKKYLYYQGCNLGVTVPFRNSIGLAISSDGGNTFEKFSKGPILDRNYREPHFVATAHVMLESGVFRMWYLSCVRWDLVDGKPKHYYHIKYAESQNGIDWKREGVVAIDFRDEHEYAIGVPRVYKEHDRYVMWYCYRGERYKIGYAESRDGVSWTRMDEKMEFDVASSGWDSEMVEYGAMINFAGKRYMFYNGNGYGRSGFGLALQTS